MTKQKMELNYEIIPERLKYDCFINENGDIKRIKVLSVVSINFNKNVGEFLKDTVSVFVNYSVYKTNKFKKNFFNLFNIEYVGELNLIKSILDENNGPIGYKLLKEVYLTKEEALNKRSDFT